MRKISLLIVFTLLISVIGCGVKDKVPGNVLSPEKMQSVLSDIMKADQFLSDYVLNRDTTKKRETESIKIYNQVFSIHKITPQKFYKSFSFYKSHPSLLQPIMDSLSKPIEAQMIEIVPTENIDTMQTVPEFKPLADTVKSRKRKIISGD